MNKKKLIPSILLLTLVWLVGAYVAYQFWWTGDDALYLFYAGVIMSFLVWLPLTTRLTGLVLPRRIPYNLKMATNKEAFKHFKAKAGAKVTYAVCGVLFFFIVALPAATGFVLLQQVQRYKKAHLAEHGKVQKIQVEWINSPPRSDTRFANFDLMYEAKRLQRQLDLDGRTYQPGDCVNIVFSPINPIIVDWAQ